MRLCRIIDLTGIQFEFAKPKQPWSLPQVSLTGLIWAAGAVLGWGAGGETLPEQSASLARKLQRLVIGPNNRDQYAPFCAFVLISNYTKTRRP
jgi:hypothetical protein